MLLSRNYQSYLLLFLRTTNGNVFHLNVFLTESLSIGWNRVRENLWFRQSIRIARTENSANEELLNSWKLPSQLLNNPTDSLPLEYFGNNAFDGLISDVFFADTEPPVNSTNSLRQQTFNVAVQRLGRVNKITSNRMVSLVNRLVFMCEQSQFSGSSCDFFNHQLQFTRPTSTYWYEMYNITCFDN